MCLHESSKLHLHYCVRMEVIHEENTIGKEKYAVYNQSAAS